MIDKDKLKNQLTQADIIKIVCSLGSQTPLEDPKGNLIFQTVCHNIDDTGKYKLYYYENTKLFTCYTGCQESFDIYDLIGRNKSLFHKEWEFKDSLFYVIDTTGYNPQLIIREETEINKIDDWNFLNQYRKKRNTIINMPIYNHHILEIYKEYYHKKWIEEGISSNAMKKFNIKFDVYNNKIIIPHYDTDYNLIGIRGRSLNKDDLEQGRKYMPVKVENVIYSHPISCSLYGLSHNLNTIRKLRKALILEGEKSVLKVESYYPNNNFSVAVCGDKISDFQKEYILKYVDEIIIGFDKKENKHEELNYLKTLARKFSPFVKTYIIYDKNNLLETKDAPVDKGKRTLEKLMKQKVEVKTIGR